MGTLDQGIYLPDVSETGWADEVNLNFNRLADVGVNVQAYGALGDGATDDYAAIAAAITAAGVGGTVLFPTPTSKYLVATGLVPLASQRWVGAGRQSWADTGAHPWISYSGTGVAINIGTADGVVLSGLRIQCTSATSSVVGVKMTDPSFWNAIEHCTIKGPETGDGTGVLLNGNSVANSFHSVRSTSFQGWGTGLRLSGWANSNHFDMLSFHASTTAVDISPLSPDTGTTTSNLFTMIEVNGDCTTGLNLGSTASSMAFIKCSDDGTTNPLVIDAAALDAVFIGCHFGTGTAVDNATPYQTTYVGCTNTPTGGGTQYMDGIIDMAETTAPAAPSSNRAKIYCRDNGSGKTQIVVRFPTGATQVMATEP